MLKSTVMCDGHLISLQYKRLGILMPCSKPVHDRELKPNKEPMLRRRWLKILVVAPHLQRFNYQYASVSPICYIRGVHGGWDLQKYIILIDRDLV
ncbi:hypothetical protein OPV22_023374 [Ensete ventricosum]|uniref:Uncharacterized protein n=1 Tax=Ensete ventricosum TaxID=4639 RepID=A0AAV8QVA9_ENSVE|nr:hypothetical protein OPV22_023374 [Ensete ventricosum]